MKVRVLSWNVHGLPAPFSKQRAQRLDRIAAVIEEEAPDITALQEVWPGCLPRLLPALPDHAAAFAPTRGGSPKGGLLLLTRRKGAWAVDESSLRFRRYAAAGPWWKLWEADGAAGKGVVFATLRRRDDVRPLRLVVTHLQSRYGRNVYEAVRRSQLRQLNEWVDALGDDAPVVVAGDFNTPAAEVALYPSVASLGLDATFSCRRERGGVTHYPVHADPGWIDYVLVRPAAGEAATASTRLILNHGVDDPYSDHHGLVTEIDVG